MTDAEEPDRFFPPTSWTVVLAARDEAGRPGEEARTLLVQAYWRPIRSYLTALGLDPLEAEDGAQEVLAALCQNVAADDVSPAKGRLRHYLKAAARHLLYNRRRAERTQKRGERATHLAWDELPANEELPEAAQGEEIFDREWAWSIFHRVLAALAESYALRGKAELFEVLKLTLLGAESVQPYAEIGARFGVGEPQIKLEVHRLRRRLGERLRAEVAATLDVHATAAEVEEETHYLIRVLAHE